MASTRDEPQPRARAAAWIAILLALVVAPSSRVPAATFPDLYTVLVTPPTDAVDSRDAGIRLAMERLLIRVTGRRDALVDPDLAPLTQAPTRYVDAVGFQTADQLMVRFNQAAVDRALTELERPIWGAERPLTLVWLAIMGPTGERAILGAGQRDPSLSGELLAAVDSVREEILAVAGERGLPITLPLLDLEDLSALDFADLWGGFNDRILAASARYRADSVLIGKLRLDPLGSELQWSLLDRGRLRAVLGGGVRDGLDSVADLYVADLATVGGLSQIRVRVLDVATLRDYGRLMSYLDSLSVLQAVELESFENGAVTLALSARGGTDVLERVLGLGGVLQPAPVQTAPYDGAAAPSLVWQLVDPARRFN